MMKAHKMFSNRPLVIWTDMREKEYWVFPTQKKAEAFLRSKYFRNKKSRNYYSRINNADYLFYKTGKVVAEISDAA